MDKTIWFFGYRGSLVNHHGGHCWYGSVAVPSWHPVRSVGLDGHHTIRLGSKWHVFADGGKQRSPAINEVCDIAFALRRMQTHWDSLSPYEREYLVR